MSVREKFFSPLSLARVARAVEWEDSLIIYKDGSSNQGRYMEALSTLYANWFRFGSLPEAIDEAEKVLASDWVGAFRLVVEAIPEKVAQLVGFYTGLGGVLMKPKSLFSSGVNPWTGEVSVPKVDYTNEVFLMVEQLITRLSNTIEGG